MLVINKFGGSVMNGAAAIKHLQEVFKTFKTGECSVNVFSAFGKTTNALEKIVEAYRSGNIEKSRLELKGLEAFHTEIITELFPKGHKIFSIIKDECDKISSKLISLEHLANKQFADQILPHGEILATKIVSDYLNLVGFGNKLVSATDFLSTDSNFGAAGVDRESLLLNIEDKISPEILKLHQHIVTQGFIGFHQDRSDQGVRWWTTLGREGSDYTAGLLGNVLNADRVILWKDVSGVMTHDPKLSSIEKIDFLTYDELDKLLESSARGLVHPKTLNEVRQKRIPLQIRPFWNLDSLGTQVK